MIAIGIGLLVGAAFMALIGSMFRDGRVDQGIPERLDRIIALLESIKSDLADSDSEDIDDVDDSWQEALAAPYLEDIRAGLINLQATPDEHTKKSNHDD